MPLDGEPPVQAQRLGGHRRHHRRVAVAVAADPRGQREPPGRGHQARVVLGHRGLELEGDPRQRVPEDLLDEVEPGAHLVGDGGAGGARALGEPERGDLRPQRGDLGVPLPGQQIGVVQAAQHLADALELREHGAALGLGRMRGEHQLDPEGAEECRHPLGRDAPALDLPDRGADRLADRRGVGASLALAQGADALRFLGQVHQIEVHGERRRRGPSRIDGEGCHLGGQVPGGRPRRRAPSLGEGANALLGLEEIGGLLGAEHVAQRLAEQVDGGREIQAIGPSSMPATRCPVSAVRAGVRGESPACHVAGEIIRYDDP